SLTEAKAHLRIDASDEDVLLAWLIGAARIFVERTLSLTLITQSWSLYLDGWPRGGALAMPLHPIQEVVAVNVYGPDNLTVEVSDASYTVDTISEPARLSLSAGAGQLEPARRLNAFEIAFTAGF